MVTGIKCCDCSDVTREGRALQEEVFVCTAATTGLLLQLRRPYKGGRKGFK